jgi:predicted RNase H-like nuclease (RuvC/YqgF family)
LEEYIDKVKNESNHCESNKKLEANPVIHIEKNKDKLIEELQKNNKILSDKMKNMEDTIEKLSNNVNNCINDGQSSTSMSL